ncbi:hypothetical protein D9758_018759 [Tetrapyrgos nigripes]|uniref:Uncharacterized protein n=1 Tax=Tetrapyrgos nigripes TaxID=182062 RepID=A0A8H5AUL3_9AGAR|nr:hypothetical protein D9758_018759 [Tetrapyrgos nigripes]
MSALSDLSERLLRNSRAIKSSATAIESAKQGKFVRAALDTELGNLIRDIEPSELGLFHIERLSTTTTHEKDIQHSSAEVQISRVEFHGATPLRKPATRREEKTKLGSRDVCKCCSEVHR